MFCWVCGYGCEMIYFPITYNTIFTAYSAVIDSNDAGIVDFSTEIQSNSSIYIRTSYDKVYYQPQVYALVIGT